jgi:hypothetical protein
MPSDAPHNSAQSAHLATLALDVKDRREFLRLLGFGAAAACLPGLLAACSSNATSTTPSSTPAPGPTGPTAPSGPAAITLDFSNDFGALNLAYLLEQLASGFYTQVKTAPPANLDSHAQYVLQQITVHEAIHASFFKTFLATNGIAQATLNLTSVNFTDGGSVLTTAKTLEDLKVGAYNGAAQLLQSAPNLTLMAKIVSVEARHAAAVRDLLAPGTSAFAGSDVIDANGFDQALQPSAVATAITPYVKNPITITNVPSTTA